MTMLSSLSDLLLLWIVAACTLLLPFTNGDAVLYRTREEWIEAANTNGFFNSEDFNDVATQHLEVNTITNLGQLSVEHDKASGSGEIRVLAGDEYQGQDTQIDFTNHLYLILDGPQENLARLIFPPPVYAWGADVRIPDYGNAPSLVLNDQVFSEFLNTSSTSFIGFVSDTAINELSFVNEGPDAAFCGLDNLVWSDQGTMQPTATPPVPVTYLGCYNQDNSTTRALPNQLELEAANGRQCADACSDLNYTYSARQDENQCWCGQGPYDIYGPSDLCQCNETNVGINVMCVWGPNPNYVTPTPAPTIDNMTLT